MQSGFTARVVAEWIAWNFFWGWLGHIPMPRRLREKCMNCAIMMFLMVGTINSRLSRYWGSSMTANGNYESQKLAVVSAMI